MIRNLMQLSDLDNLLSVGTICYQFGESFLNVFLLHKLDNLLSVYIFYQYWIILLSVLGTIGFSNLDEFWENFQRGVISDPKNFVAGSIH